MLMRFSLVLMVACLCLCSRLMLAHEEEARVDVSATEKGEAMRG